MKRQEPELSADAQASVDQIVNTLTPMLSPQYIKILRREKREAELLGDREGVAKAEWGLEVTRDLQEAFGLGPKKKKKKGMDPSKKTTRVQELTRGEEKA